MSICIVSCIALLHIITLSTTHDTRNRSTGAACRVLLRLRLVSYAYPRPGEGDLRERIPLLTSSSADGRDARSLSSLSYMSARVYQRRGHIPRACSSPTLPSFQQEHHQVVLPISSLPLPHRNGLTLQNTLILQFIGRTPSLVQQLQLCPISSTVGFKIMTLINDSTLLCCRSRNYVGYSIMRLLMSLPREVGCSVQSGCSG
jgi:hypothetical protein